MNTATLDEPAWRIDDWQRGHLLPEPEDVKLLPECNELHSFIILPAMIDSGSHPTIIRDWGINE